MKKSEMVGEMDELIDGFDASVEENDSFEVCEKAFRQMMAELSPETRMAMREAIMDEPTKGQVFNAILLIIDELNSVN